MRYQTEINRSDDWRDTNMTEAQIGRKRMREKIHKQGWK